MRRRENVSCVEKRRAIHSSYTFAVETPQYTQKVLDAMAEARKISRDNNIRGYDTMEELKAALEADILTLTLVDTGSHSEIFKK